MLFSKLYKNMVKKDTFVDFRGGDRPNRTPRSAPAKHCGFKATRLVASVGLLTKQQ